MFAAFLLLALFSCSSSPVTLAQNCDVRLATLAPTTTAAGDTVRATGGPMTTVWDTAVYVDGNRAEVIALDREGCEACDTCKADNSCQSCDDCDACDAICDTDCVESVDFIAPNISSESGQVAFYNGHGQSNAIPLMYSGQTDTGVPSDSGEIPSPVDSGSPEDTSSL